MASKTNRSGARGSRWGKVRMPVVLTPGASVERRRCFPAEPDTGVYCFPSETAVVLPVMSPFEG